MLTGTLRTVPRRGRVTIGVDGTQGGGAPLAVRAASTERLTRPRVVLGTALNAVDSCACDAPASDDQLGPNMPPTWMDWMRWAGAARAMIKRSVYGMWNDVEDVEAVVGVVAGGGERWLGVESWERRG